MLPEERRMGFGFASCFLCFPWEPWLERVWKSYEALFQVWETWKGAKKDDVKHKF